MPKKIKIMLIITLVLVLLLACFPVFTFVVRPNLEQLICRFQCRGNLEQIGKGLSHYRSQNEEKYPGPAEWCDLLIEHADISNKQFKCKGALEFQTTDSVSEKTDFKLFSFYAINPDCQPNSPNDLVLLFESKGGWNQYGGPELLNFENHNDKGCNILFNDKSVKFIKPDQVTDLNWGQEK
jgi:hypothetical protein